MKAIVLIVLAIQILLHKVFAVWDLGEDFNGKIIRLLIKNIATPINLQQSFLQLIRKKAKYARVSWRECWNLGETFEGTLDISWLAWYCSRENWDIFWYLLLKYIYCVHLAPLWEDCVVYVKNTMLQTERKFRDLPGVIFTPLERPNFNFSPVNNP